MLENDEVKKTIIHMCLVILFVSFLSFLWWGPFKEIVRIKTSL